MSDSGLILFGLCGDVSCFFTLGLSVSESAPASDPAGAARMPGGGIWRRKKKKKRDEEILDGLVLMTTMQQRVQEKLKELAATEKEVEQALALVRLRKSIFMPPPARELPPLPPIVPGQKMTYDRLAIERAREPIRKQELVERLRAGREAKKQREEEIRQQRLKNLAKARKAKKNGT